MVDNIELIKPLLKFESGDDFYYLQILQRKKENKLLNSNSRVIKNYYIRSIEHLENRYKEIKNLCVLFNARASIRLNKRSFEKVTFKTMQNIANTMMSRDYNFINKAYDRACGQSHNDSDKKWIVDLDEIYQTEPEYLERLQNRINKCLPEGNKIIASIPSKNGLHLISSPFNLQEFREFYKYQIEIHKDNPTNLFIP